MPSPPSVSGSDNPNVVLVTGHDFGRELGCYGRQAFTPQLDELAEQGVLFEQHFCTAPHCAPSRASVTTGLQPHNHGMLGHPHAGGGPSYFNNPYKGWEIDDGIPTLPVFLNHLGYETHLVGGVHSNRATYGHDHFHFAEDRPTSTVPALTGASQVESVLESVSGSDPFYLEVATQNAHMADGARESVYERLPAGYDGPDPADIDLSSFLRSTAYDDPESNIREVLADEETARETLAVFYEVMYEFDAAVGQMLDALEATGHRDDTLFIVTADHGLGLHNVFPKCKGTLYDRGVESALLMQYPGRVEGGQRHETLVSNVDVLPTILDFTTGDLPVSVDSAGVPSDVDGQSLRPLIDSADERAYDERSAVFFERTYYGVNHFGPYDPVRGIRTAEYKLLRNYWPKHYEFTPRDGTTEIELYDLAADPHECENLTTDPAAADIREQLHDRLRSRLEADGDPVLDGPIPPADGAFDIGQ